MKEVTVIAGNFIIPSCLLFINLMIRSGKKIPASTGADIILFFAGFDAMVLFSYKDFTPLIQLQDFKDNIIPIFTTLLIIGFAIWIATVNYVEKHILINYDYSNHKYKRFPIVRFIFAMGSIFAVITVHVSTFLCREDSNVNFCLAIVEAAHN